MSPDLFRSTREANPFQPFIIHLADGRSYPVAHRDFCIQGPAGHRAIWVFREDGSSSLLDLNLVTELEISALPTITQPPSPGANGA